MADNEMTRTNPTAPNPALTVATPTTRASTPSALSGTHPTGIKLIALLAFLQGFLGLCGACVVLGASGIITLIPTGVTQVVGVLGILLGLVLGAGPLLHLVFAYGAWNLRSWAWWLGILATCISVVSVILSTVASGGATAWTAVTHALLPIIIFIYLLMPNVRKAFNT